MKKFNVRLPVILALSLSAGIAVALILFLYGLGAEWLALAFAPALLVLTVWALISKKILKPVLFVLFPLALFFTGALNGYFLLKRYDNTEIMPETKYYIQGVVIEKGITSNGEYAVIDNVTLDGRKIDGKMNLFLFSSYGEFFDVGYTVNFYGMPQAYPTFAYGKLNYRAEENIKYSAAVYAGLQSSYKFSLLGSVRNALRERLFANLSKETAAVSFAMLTGNVQYMEEQSLEMFRRGGIAHIFAVSGLHIAIIFGLCAFLCKKSNLNKYLSAVICISLTAFYVALCGFTLSAVRAELMCAVATLARLCLQKNDGLNSLSIAVIIILIASPLSLFSVGFQLSVSAVGGISAFSKLYTKFLKKIKVPQKISSAAGISLGAQTATAPLLLANFGYLSGAGLILNLFIVPILSVTYILIFIAALISLVIPPAAPFLLPYAALPLELFFSFLTGIGFEKTLISGFGAGLFVPVYFIGILALSDKLNLKLITRLFAVGCSIIILASYVLIRYSYPFNGYNVIVSAYGTGGEVIIKSRYGIVLIVSDDVNVSRLESVLNNHYINEIDSIVIIGENCAETYARLDLNCSEIHLNDSFPQLQPYGDILLIYEKSFNTCGVNFNFNGDDALYAELGGIKIGVLAGENLIVPDCDILISDTENTFANCKTEIYFNNPFGELNVLQCGDISIYVANGEYNIKTTLPPQKTTAAA